MNTDNDTFVVFWREDDLLDGSKGPFKRSRKEFKGRTEAEKYAATIHPGREAFVCNVTPEAKG